MDIWKILGIEPTKDKSILKQAYRKCLQTVNPEDDAQGFMELRAAFEQANKLADMEDMPTGEEMTPLEQRIFNVYSDFSKRISIDAWEALFDEDAFVVLDSSEESFTALIHFLMKHYYLPKRVWRYIVHKFEIRERRRELCEQFPAEFIDYMINNATFDDLISYDLFEGDDSQFDDYLTYYYRLDAAIRKHESDKLDKYFDLLAAMDVSHPYLEIAHIRVALQNLRDDADNQGILVTAVTKNHEEKLKALEKTAHALQEMYPVDLVILHTCGDLALVQNHLEEAKYYYDKTLALAKDNYIVKGKQAELAFCMGDYIKSRDLYLELLRINHYDNHVRAGMIRANACLIEQYKKKLEENPDDTDTSIEMAWSHYQSYHFEEAIECVKDIVPVGKQIFEVHNVRGRSYLCLEQYEKAIDDFFIWKEAIEGLDSEDNSEETKKLRKRLPYVNFLISDCYLKTKKYEQARKYLDLAMATEHDEIILSFEAKCELEYKTQNYEACIDACEALISRDERSFIAYMFSAKASFELNYIKESFVACERAINLYPYVAEPYSLEAQIYIKAGQTELAKKTLDRFRAFGIESDELDFCDASILELDNKHEEIVALLTKTVERANTVHTDKEDFEEILMMLAFHLERLGRYAEAKTYYERVFEINPDHLIVNGRLGIIYRKLSMFDSALACINKQLEIRKHPLYYIEQGMILRCLARDKEAISSFETVLLYDSKNVFCLSEIANIYEEIGKFLPALTYYRKAYDNCSKEEAEEKETLHAGIARVLQCLNVTDANYFKESEEMYKTYMESYGPVPNIVYDYAELLVRMNNAKGALSLLKPCIMNEENDKGKRQMCARQYIHICGLEGNQSKIKEMFSYLVSDNFEIEARTYATLGRAYFNCGNISLAIANFEKATKLDKDNKQNYYGDLMEAVCSKFLYNNFKTEQLFIKTMNLLKTIHTPNDCLKAATVYRLMGKVEQANKFIDKALRMKRCNGCFYSRCHEALYERALAFERVKDYKMAKMCLQEAIDICGHNALYERKLNKMMKKCND